MPLFFPVIGSTILAWIRAVNRFARFDRRGPGFELIRDGKPYILTSWHEDFLLTSFEMSRSFRKFPHVAMVSAGRMGALSSYMFSQFGVRAIAGSGSSQGIRAVKRLVRNSRLGRASVYIASDGSRGPSRQMRWGAIYVARDTGLPIIASRTWSNCIIRLPFTWMRLALPLPWGRTVVLTAEPLYVPADADKPQLNECRAELQRRLDAITQASLDYFTKGESAADAFGPRWLEFPEPPPFASQTAGAPGRSAVTGDPEASGHG